MKKLKDKELFAGIGAQREALKRAEIEHEVVAISEIDKYALKAYELLHGVTPNLDDISKNEKLPIADMWTYSFPCFTGDSLVLTADGYKEIKVINVGDFILSHDKCGAVGTEVHHIIHLTPENVTDPSISLN